MASNALSQDDCDLEEEKTALLAQFIDQKVGALSTWSDTFKITELFHQGQDYKSSQLTSLGQCSFHWNTTTHINTK